MQDDEKNLQDEQTGDLHTKGDDPQEGPAQDPITEEEKEYEDAWRELDEAEKGNKPSDTDADLEDKGLPDQKGEAKPDGKTPEPKGDGKVEKPEDEESVAKALKDTKAWATKLSMEKAELEKELKALKAGTGSEQKVADAKAAVKIATEGFDEQVKSFYKDYPEAKDVLDPLIEMTRSMAAELADIKKKDAAREQASKESEDKKVALEAFNRDVRPKILEVHKDFDSIIQDRAYFDWAAKQTPAMRYAAETSWNPEDIIMAVTAYKKFNSSDEMKRLKEKEKTDRETKLKNAQTLRGGTTPIKRTTGEDPSDYDSAWEKAGKELDREGIR